MIMEQLAIDQNRVQQLKERFLSSFTNVQSAIESAARNLVELIDYCPEQREKLIRDGISRHIINQLEEIGRGRLLPGLFNAPKKVQHLLPSEQKRLLSETIPVVVKKDDGDVDIIQARFDTMSKDQVEQILAYDHIRTEEEQRMYMLHRDSQQEKPTKKPAAMPWVVVGRTIQIKQPMTVTRSQLLDMCRALEV
jgi:hypothetical protein